MSDYRRVYVDNASYFFTVVTYRRRPLFAREDNVDRLRQAVRYVMDKRPFALDAMVVLPDHLHCLWRMTADHDYSIRWQMIKTRFSRGIEAPAASGGGKRVWQPRFWEHLIRDEADLRRHLDYIHYNPVKHGYVDTPGAWPHSSFARFAARGCYPPDWGAQEPRQIRGMEQE